jgi:hypothetical protein
VARRNGAQTVDPAEDAQGPAPQAQPQTGLTYSVSGGGAEDAGGGVVLDVERTEVSGEVVPYPKRRDTFTPETQRKGHETRRRLEEERFKADLERVRKENRRRPRVVLKDIPVSQIVRETIYNRKLDVARARRYARKFDWRLFQTVSLNQREDGSLNLVDGQHRVAAAVIVWGPQVSVPCTLTKYGDVGQEAGAFDEINSSRSPLLFQTRFNARLLAGRPDAVALSALIEEAGLQIGPGKWVNESRPGEITVLGTLSRMYNRYGPMAVAEAVGVLKASWGDDPQAYRAALLEATGLLHVLYPGQVRPERLIGQLRLRTPEQVVREAARFQSGVMNRNTITTLYALQAIYNRSLMLMSQLPPLAVRADGKLMLGNAGYTFRKMHPPAKPETFDQAIQTLKLYALEWADYAARLEQGRALRATEPAEPQEAAGA